MPTYEYECLACRNRFERFQKFRDAAVTECPECAGAVRRVLFPAGIVFKGSGWYKTEGRPSVSSENGSAATASGETKSDSKTETKSGSKSDSKGETKTETKSDSKSKGDSKSETSSSKSAGSTPPTPAKA